MRKHKLLTYLLSICLILALPIGPSYAAENEAITYIETIHLSTVEDL